MQIKLNLKNKILIPIFTIIAMAIFITGGVIYYSIKSGFIDKNINNLEVIIELKTNEIKQFIGSNKLHLFEIFDSNKFKSHITSLENNKDSIDYEESLEYLKDNIEHFSHHKDILTTNLINKEGIIIISSLGHGTDTDFKDKKVKDTFGTLIDNKIRSRKYLLEITKSKHHYDSNGKVIETILLSIPLYSKEYYLGAILVEINSYYVNKILSNKIGLGNTGKSYLISNNRNDSEADSIYNINIINSCLRNKDASFREKYYNHEGKYVIGIGKYIGELEGCLITEIEENEVLEVINTIIIWYLLSGFMVFIPTYFSISFFIKKVTKPLNYLEKITREIEKGNLDIDIRTVESGDELEHLTKAFKDMVLKVRETDKVIRKQVFKQTRKIITHQEETEKLNLELKKFKQSVDNASDYITILDWNINVVYINKAFQKDLGYSLKEIIDFKSQDKYRTIEGEKNLDTLWNKLRKNKKPKVVEFKVLKKNGSSIISEAYITPILNESGSNILFYLLVEHDITKEKETEEMKNEFLSIASHELRTPMTVIKGYSALLLDQKLGDINDNQRKYLDKIKNNSSNLIHIVNDMLDIGKLEADKMEINYKEFNLKEFIDDIVISFKPMFEEKNITLVGNSIDMMFVSDELKINQIFTNLIGNAIKFTPEGGKVELNIEKENKRLKLSVQDSGIGIEKEDLNKLFKKFSQIESHLQRQVSGTGLGLVICKLIVGKLGGTIGVESKKGKGTKFFFYIPINNKLKK